MTAQLLAIIAAHGCMALAAIDYSARRPFAWTEWLGAAYALGLGATL